MVCSFLCLKDQNEVSEILESRVILKTTARRGYGKALYKINEVK